MRTVPIATLVSASEQQAVEAAGRHFARALSEASGEAWQCEFRPFEPGAILLTSLGPEVADDEPWAETEARLRARYADAGADPVFICTVLRHVRDADPAEARRRLIRIRRLNLLAAQLSQESGAFVIDLDRALADIGAARLQTDYRLEGDIAADQAGHVIAMAILVNGLDQLASVELQDAARAILARYQPPLGLPVALRPQLLLEVGTGRRRQVAVVEAGTAEHRHAFLLRQVLKRQIGPGAAASIFVQKVREVGLRDSVRLAATALRRLVAR